MTTTRGRRVHLALGHHSSQRHASCGFYLQDLDSGVKVKVELFSFLPAEEPTPHFLFLQILHSEYEGQWSSVQLRGFHTG